MPDLRVGMQVTAYGGYGIRRMPATILVKRTEGEWNSNDPHIC